MGVLLGLGGLGIAGCSSDCASEQEEVEEFLVANRACQVDEDCAVVHTGCHDYTDAGGFCGQAAISEQAASSSRWKDLREELYDCEEGEECAHCLAGLVPACNAGTCGRAQ
jgi:hypothetical protein